jgi:hypothetical protein
VREGREARAVAAPLSWHPTRREMLIATRFADTPQFTCVKDAAAGRGRSSRSSAIRVGRRIVQPTRGDFFVYSKDAGGNEFAQLYRFDTSRAANRRC